MVSEMIYALYIRCLEDEDLDAIGISDPTHRQIIKSYSQQEEEQPSNEDLDALNFDNVLNDLDSIIDSLGAFGNVRFCKLNRYFVVSSCDRLEVPHLSL